MAKGKQRKTNKPQNKDQSKRDAQKRTGGDGPRFAIEALEPRILLSATWVDAHTSEAHTDATSGDDVYHGTDGADQVDGLGGHDVLHGHGGDDALAGGAGNDTLHGGAGHDVLMGGTGDDVLESGGGNDQLLGQEGSDTLRITDPQHGDVITVDGGSEHDTLDLSNYSVNDLTVNGSQVVVNMGGGQSFTVNFSNIETIRTSDGLHLPGNVTSGQFAPTVDAGADQSVDEGTLVHLNGSGMDINDQALTYHWVQTGGPAVTLSDAHAANPTFVAPDGTRDSQITFELHVSNGTDTSIDTMAVQVHADNDAPTADAGADHIVYEGSTVHLAGSGTDPEGSGLTYHWVQTGGPAVNLGDAHAADATFEAPDTTGATHLTFDLTVTDSDGLSHTDSVELTVHDPQVESYVHGLTYQHFRDLTADQVDYLTPQQIATIPNTDWLGTMSAEARASLDQTQVQGLDTAHVGINHLTQEQRDWLTADQVQHLNYQQFRYLSASGVDHLTAEQISTIPNTDWLGTMSADARASLDQTQVQGLDTAHVGLNHLTQEQVDWLTPDQVQHLNYQQFRYLSASGVDHLTAEQIATIPNTDWLGTMSADARASLDQTQVQGLDTAHVGINHLTQQQRDWLTADQVQHLNYQQFRYLSASGVDHLTAEQIATIPNTDWLGTMSAEARASLDQTQVQGLDTAHVGINHLTQEQVDWLTPDQVQHLNYQQFRYLSASGVDHLTAEQISTIPNTDWLGTMSADARASLDQTQVQGLDTAHVGINHLTQQQRDWLTADQVQHLNYQQFRYLSASGVDHLTAAQISTIPNTDWLGTMSADARASLDQTQVQGLNTATVGINHLTQQQRDWLTADQVQHLNYQQFRYLSASGVDHLTAAQISTIPNTDWLGTMSADARASLDQTQVQGLNTATVGINHLTQQQRDWLTPNQVQQLGYQQFRYLSASGVDHLTAQQVATIPSSDWMGTMSASARASFDQTQVQAINTASVGISQLTSAQREWLSTDQVQHLNYQQFRYLPVSRIPELTTTQIGTIPSADWFNTMSADQRNALTHDQIRALPNNLANVSFVGAGSNDTLTGNTNVNKVVGGAGNDTLAGGEGKDVLDGGDGSDTLTGGAGDDLLIAGGGNDTASGGTGNDTFAVEGARAGDVISADGGEGVDVIDLRTFHSTDAELSTGHIVVNLPGGGAFTINHSNMEQIRFADTTVVPVYNTAPTAEAGVEQRADAGATVQLSGSAVDPDAQALTYEWVQTGGPAVTLSDAHAANPTFVAPVVGEATNVTFELHVNDGVATSVDAVSVAVEPAVSAVQSPSPAAPQAALASAPPEVGSGSGGTDPAAEPSAEPVAFVPEAPQSDLHGDVGAPQPEVDAPRVDAGGPQAAPVSDPFLPTDAASDVAPNHGPVVEPTVPVGGTVEAVGASPDHLAVGGSQPVDHAGGSAGGVGGSQASDVVHTPVSVVTPHAAGAGTGEATTGVQAATPGADTGSDSHAPTDRSFQPVAGHAPIQSAHSDASVSVPAAASHFVQTHGVRSGTGPEPMSQAAPELEVSTAEAAFVPLDSSGDPQWGTQPYAFSATVTGNEVRTERHTSEDDVAAGPEAARHARREAPVLVGAGVSGVDRESSGGDSSDGDGAGEADSSGGFGSSVFAWLWGAVRGLSGGRQESTDESSNRNRRNR